MPSQPIIIANYDPAWPETFRTLSLRLSEALDPLARRIEHVGSTSVTGLAAKPIIDIDIVIPHEADLALATDRLAAIGYVYEGQKGIEGRHAFKPPNDLPKHHPYVCAEDNAELARHLAFRDHLRRSPDDVRAYADLKRALATRYGADRDGYTDAKAEFVEAILRRAASSIGADQS